MPLYEYKCDACGNRFERIQKFSDPLVSVCPTCGGEVQKLVSSPAIQFKGSGFYITDYPKSGSGAEAGKSQSSESSSGPGDSAEAKSTPAAATDAKAGDKKSGESSTKAEPAKTPAGSTSKP